MNAYYMLLADKNVAVGDVIPNVDVEDRPNAAYSDPRCIEISEMLDGRADDCLVDMVREGDDSPIRVVRVSPSGEVRPHSEIYDDGAEVDDSTALESDGGWSVDEIVPLDVVLGPQAEQILAAVREGIRVLEDEDDEAISDAYNAAVNAQYDDSVVAVLRASENAAEEALAGYGADTYWWTSCIGCCWGKEIVALAARDLIGSTPSWTQAAYDVLTQPWRTAFAQPLHPGDSAVTA